MTNAVPSECSQWSSAVIQIKVKGAPVHNTKKYCGYRAITPCTRTWYQMDMNGQLHVLAI